MFKRSKAQEKKGSEKREVLLVSFLKVARFVFAIIDIINSVADVYDTQTERFIEENPNWLNVDFTTKSIISVRTVLVSSNYWQATKVRSFSIFDGDQDYHMIKGDYYLVVEEQFSAYDDPEDEDESQYRIYQVAFVTDKVPSDARIKMNWDLIITPESK